jgi:hypothetical protein
LAIRDIPTFPPGLREHANKLNGLFARLLLTIHAIECSPRFRTDLFEVVSEATARRARDLMVRFFIPHAVRIYTDYFGGCDERGTDVQWVAGHILAHRYERFTERDLYRAEKKYAEDRPRLHRAIRTLADCGWLDPVTPRRPADKPTAWTVNPLVHTQFADRAEQERQRREAVRNTIAGQKKVLTQAWK